MNSRYLLVKKNILNSIQKQMGSQCKSWSTGGKCRQLRKMRPIEFVYNLQLRLSKYIYKSLSAFNCNVQFIRSVFRDMEYQTLGLYITTTIKL